eukprot:TRINITY_DN43345_c0_g1_i1.p1 TRINITY_DN43345_c0_g1~~TRINITY_DN43345_c0_g1_i1.p1  ORF type:complete len:1190 (+),score=243.81 TRINITY_DN43345_c0_g1_i1:48-3572(+)
MPSSSYMASPQAPAITVATVVAGPPRTQPSLASQYAVPSTVASNDFGQMCQPAPMPGSPVFSARGTRQSFQGSGQPNQAQEAAPNERVCSCGVALTADSIFCRHCGKPATESVQAVSVSLPPTAVVGMQTDQRNSLVQMSSAQVQMSSAPQFSSMRMSSSPPSEMRRVETGASVSMSAPVQIGSPQDLGMQQFARTSFVQQSSPQVQMNMPPMQLSSPSANQTRTFEVSSPFPVSPPAVQMSSPPANETLGWEMRPSFHMNPPVQMSSPPAASSIQMTNPPVQVLSPPNVDMWSVQQNSSLQAGSSQKQMSAPQAVSSIPTSLPQMQVSPPQAFSSIPTSSPQVQMSSSQAVSSMPTSLPPAETSSPPVQMSSQIVQPVIRARSSVKSTLENTEPSSCADANPRICACGNRLLLDARFCRMCGKEWGVEREASKPASEEWVDFTAPQVVLPEKSNPPSERPSVDFTPPQVVLPEKSASAEEQVSPIVANYESFDDNDVSSEPIQCTCGSIFMDDSKFCRKCGADRKISEALLIIERDHDFFASELNKIPGGAQALEVLRSVNQNGDGKPAALGKVRESINCAKQGAKEKAKEAQQLAQLMRDKSRDAEMLAEKANQETRDNEIEHQQLADLAKKSKEDEARAEKEARRAKELADQAAREADAAKAAWLAGKQQAEKHDAHRGHLSMKLDDVKKLAARKGVPLNPIDAAASLRFQRIEADKKAGQAKRNQELAAKAAQTAKEKEALADRLQQSSQPGGALEGLIGVQQQVNVSNKARSIAHHARKKADSLAAQLAQLAKEAQYAEQMARQAESEAAESAKQTSVVLQQSQAAQNALSLHISGEAGCQLTPETARQAVDEARKEAEKAREAFAVYTKLASEDGHAAEAALREVEHTEQITEGLSNANGLDEELDRAHLLADQAKAHADALAAAAAAAAKHAQGCHQRSQRAEGILNDHKQRGKDLAAKERAAWQKTFGERAAPQGAVSPSIDGYPTDGYPTEAAREKARAEQMLRDAAKAEEDAAKAEAQAERLDQLLGCLEKAKLFEEQLRPASCECGSTFAEDSNFCRRCGRPRMQGWAWGGYDKSMAPVREKAKLAANDIEARASNVSAYEDHDFHQIMPVKVVEVVQEPAVIDYDPRPSSSGEIYSLDMACAPEMYFSLFNGASREFDQYDD